MTGDPKESSRMELVIDTVNLPDVNKQEELIDDVCRLYNIDRKANKFTVQILLNTAYKRSTLKLKIEAIEEGLPIVAALEVFVMKLGNFIIYKKVIQYEHAPKKKEIKI